MGENELTNNSKCQYPCRILAGKRIAIPKEIIINKGWKDGDYVLLKSHNDGLEIVGLEFKEK